MVDAAELRAKVKKCINALDSKRPVVFGSDPLISGGAASDLYVPGLHGGDKDLIRVLADRIGYDEGGGTYLFSGNRGTGKTTELMRLAEQLRQEGCEVFYVDMAEYLNLTISIEITDFLISLLGGFSEKIMARYGKNPGSRGFFERIGDFLQSEVKVEGFDIATLKVSLQQDPTFKETVQKRTQGHVARLVREARGFVEDAVAEIRKNVPTEKKIVLIVDSVEQLRGVGDSKSVAKVFESVENLFAGHSDKLRFSPLFLVCTVPPYLSALAGSVASLYSGGQIYMLPSVHVYEGKPLDGKAPIPSETGLQAMVDIVTKRFPEWIEFFTRDQMIRLAGNSGGDLRDYFRMIGLCITEAPYQSLPFPEKVIASAESALRNDMPLADDIKEWLRKVQTSHERELGSQDKLPIFARLTEGKYILNYRNGYDWFDVHPLLRTAVSSGD